MSRKRETLSQGKLYNTCISLGQHKRNTCMLFAYLYLIN